MEKIKIYIEHFKNHVGEKGIVRGILYSLLRYIQHTTVYRHIKLYKVKVSKKEIRKDDNLIGLFDTQINTDNAGDYIVMDYCSQIVHEIFPESEFVNVPTHTELTEEECDKMRKAKNSFVCGTSILWGKMEKYPQWMLPNDVSCYKDMCLLGVGWNRYDEHISKYSRDFYNTLLNKRYIHSVRDEYTKSMLGKMGITNVVNTACPTMWRLTPEFCNTIPTAKAKSVIATITDYNQDKKNDKLMLDILKRNYEKVYVWLQGSRDKEYLEEISNIDEYELVEGTLEAYDDILQKEKELDYVGTRLHGGIRALNHCKRSIIIIIDNRAREISKDTNLAAVERDKIEQFLEKMIINETKMEVKIPLDNIKLWKEQFK